MESTPYTVIAMLSFLAIFTACILWATSGHPADENNEDLGVVAKDH